MLAANHWTEHEVPDGGVGEGTEDGEGICSKVGKGPILCLHLKVTDKVQKQLTYLCPKPVVVAHAFNPSTGESEAGRFLSSRPA